MAGSDYGLLLENPRRRRRKGGRKGRRRARRRNPVQSVRRRRTRKPVSVSTWRASGFARNPRRRRRRSGSRSRRRSSSRRRNPFKIPGLGGLGTAFTKGAALFGAEFVGDIFSRALGRFVPPLTRFGGTPAVRQGIARLLVGTVGDMVLSKLKFIPRGVREAFGPINIASGLVALTYPMRERLLAGTLKLPQLSDYEVADYEVADYEVADYRDRLLGTYQGPDQMFGESPYEDEDELSLADSGDPYSHYN